MWPPGRAAGGRSARTSDSRSHSVQQLHDVVEPAVAGDAEVVELDRVRRAKPGRGLRLAAEAAPPRRGRDPSSMPRSGDQLDRGGPGEEPVLGPPDLTHAAPADQLDQAIAAQLARAADLAAQVRDDLARGARPARRRCSSAGRSRPADQAGRLESSRPGDQQAHRVHRGGEQRAEEHLCAAGPGTMDGKIRIRTQSQDSRPASASGCH